jgi:hypothetical protein
MGRADFRKNKADFWLAPDFPVTGEIKTPPSMLLSTSLFSGQQRLPAIFKM